MPNLSDMRTAARRTRRGRAGAALAACLLAGAALPAFAGGDTVDDFRDSWADRALELQYDLGSDVPLANAPFLSTHNSFNSSAELGSELSFEDSNQQLSLVDQLELGVRSLELDLHRFPSAGPTGITYRPVVCHSRPGGSGCSTEKELEPILVEIAGWLRAPENSEEVLLLYLEDDLDTEATHDQASKSIERQLGDLVYRPDDGSDDETSCVELPAAELTRADVRAADKQVVIVSGCGKGAAWQSLAHSWEEHRESRPFDFEDFPGCGPDYDRLEYDKRIIRYYEDSTRATSGVGTVDNGLTPETTAAMTRCGVDLIAFDQLEAVDERLEASVWSWNAGEPSTGGCALMRLGGKRFPFGRWVSRSCRSLSRSPACLDADGESWIVPRTGVVPRRAEDACERRDASWAVPRTGYENQLLRLEMRDRKIRTAMLGYREKGEDWVAKDSRLEDSAAG